MTLSFDEKLARYARLAVETGCALRQGQELFVAADVSQVALVRHIVKCAYEAGAARVTTRFTDEKIVRYDYDYQPAEAFKTFPDWLALLQNGVAERGAALLFVTSEDPLAMAGVDPAKRANRQIAAHEACRAWRDGMDFGRNVWCIIGGASPAWAARVFPDLPADQATARLWEAIFTTARCTGDDPAANWAAHQKSFEEKKAWLNAQRFDALHYTNGLGTDLTIGLNPGHVWEGGGETTQDGTLFFPNMPTEEVFTTPDRTRADGVVYASLPLNHGGSLVDGFHVEFKDGRVAGCAAEVGQDVLEQIIGTDEGAHHLGECALVPKTSPIKQEGILFLNTLFDENAACHLALGMGFPECLEGGRDLTSDELVARGVNQSATHVDFMIGTDDLAIDGITADGTVVPVFRDGTWAN